MFVPAQTVVEEGLATGRCVPQFAFDGDLLQRELLLEGDQRIASVVRGLMHAELQADRRDFLAQFAQGAVVDVGAAGADQRR